MSDQTSGFIARLDAVDQRLAAQARADLPAGALTDPDPPTGEQWEAGQVWAHLAEFIPYWLGEAATLIEHGHDAEPVPFGRTKSDPGRLAAIERDRAEDRRNLWHRVSGDIDALRTFLGQLRPADWTARGLHPTLGEMDLPRFLDEFLVGHLEQHAAQLDRLAGR